MPVMGEIRMNLTNTDCVRQDRSCKENSSPTGDKNKTGVYKESDYIEADNESHG